MGRLVIVRVLTCQDEWLTRSWGGLPGTPGISAYKGSCGHILRRLPFQMVCFGRSPPWQPQIALVEDLYTPLLTHCLSLCLVHQIHTYLFFNIYLQIRGNSKRLKWKFKRVCSLTSRFTFSKKIGEVHDSTHMEAPCSVTCNSKNYKHERALRGPTTGGPCATDHYWNRWSWSAHADNQRRPQHMAEFKKRILENVTQAPKLNHKSQDFAHERQHKVSS